MRCSTSTEILPAFVLGVNATNDGLQLDTDDDPEPLPTFEQLCEIEPRLVALYNEAKAIKDNRRKRSFCANACWYGRGPWPGLKERLCELVGWSVERRGGDPRLATCLAYDVAYHAIYNALPDCRNCVCCVFQELVDERLGR